MKLSNKIKKVITIGLITGSIFAMVGCSSSTESDEVSKENTPVVEDTTPELEEEIAEETVQETYEETTEESTYEPELVSYEVVKNEAIAQLEENFGQNGEVKVYEEDGSDVVLFSIPSPEGIVEGITAINLGMADDELIESYEYMKDSLIDLSEGMFELGETSGKTFAIGLQNNQNTENLLLTILNGVVIDETVNY